MQALWQFIRRLVIPTGATTGARIVLDGTTGIISVYNSSGVLVDQIGGPNGEIISYNAAMTQFVALLNGAVDVGAVVGGVPDLTDAAVLQYIQTGTVAYLQATAPIFGANNDQGTMLLFSGSGGVGQAVGGPYMNFIDQLATSSMTGYISGWWQKISLDGSTPFTWQTAGFNATAWTRNGFAGELGAQYGFDAMDNLVIQGSVQAVNAIAAASDTVVFTLPTAPVNYVPKNGLRLPIYQSTGSGVVAFLIIQPASKSVIIMNPTAAAVGAVFEFSVSIPMGNKQ